MRQNTPCIFTPLASDADSIDMEPSPSIRVDEGVSEDFFTSTLSEDGINFSQWVNRVSRADTSDLLAVTLINSRFL